MKKSTILIIIIVLVGLGYTNTFFQVKEAASNVIDNAEAIDFRIDNISLIPPSADLTLFYRVFNPSSYGFTYSAEIEVYVDDDYITTFIIEDEFIRADGESIIPVEVRIGGGTLSLIEAIVGDPVYRYETQTKIRHKMLGIIPITIRESYSG